MSWTAAAASSRSKSRYRQGARQPWRRGLSFSRRRIWPALTQAQAGTRVEGTITAGGTAQPLFGVTPVSGFEVINTHASEILYIRENGTASVADNTFNVPVPPRGSYTTPPGYKPTGDVSVVAATTGHAVIGRRW
jgi:hypothetical protein